MGFLCQKIKGPKFFERKLKGTESLIDLRKYKLSGIPDLKKEQPLQMKLENQTRTLSKKKRVYLKQFLLFAATMFKKWIFSQQASK